MKEAARREEKSREVEAMFRVRNMKVKSSCEEYVQETALDSGEGRKKGFQRLDTWGYESMT